MKKSFWKSDWLASLVIIITVFILSRATPIFDNFERAAYDFGVKHSEATPSDKVAVIAIDDTSIANIGRWPWPRSQQAEIINFISQGEPAVIGYVPLFSEPQTDPGLTYISSMREFFEQSSLNDLAALAEAESSFSADTHSDDLLDGISTPDNTAEQELGLDPFTKRTADDAASLLFTLYEAEDALNADLQLSQAMASAGNVVSQIWLGYGDPYRAPDELPRYIQSATLSTVTDRVSAQEYGLMPIEMQQAAYPLQSYAEAAQRLGHLTILPDVDGKIRSEQLAISYNGQYYPSFALQVAASYLGIKQEKIDLKLGEGIGLGKLFIGTNADLSMNNFYYQEGAFPVDSIFDIVTEKIPLSKYKDKVVLIGPTAVGVGQPLATPTNPSTPPVIALAHIVSSIMGEDFFVKPDWGIWITILAFLSISAFLMFILPKLNARNSAIATVALALGMFGTHYILMTGSSMWIELMLPTSLLLIGYLLVTTKRFLLTERGKMASDLDAAETNKMLGLAYQGKGDLDMAFDRFRKCPMDEALMEVIYNLALDFERKRQFSKAANAYEHIAKTDIHFRDVKQRIERSKKLDETLVLGGAGGGTAGTLIMEGDGMQKPMLGRYEIQKELGKGAMGVVYLGEDPKISRTVAIKTMALAQEFDEDELEEVKERFFREAETAGRLNHPNIVTIYDAGDEHDLAYIAMEFLKGKDLAPNCKPGALLPLTTVLTIVAECADALAYAHKFNVVHRDIKPANIMYDPDSKITKVTDFGIARITDASKTKTGVVLGTPSFMSPEQLSGKKVDGRSDLFSLGVMLYQMACGKLPFVAESMATLMFKITNDETPSILVEDPELPAKLDSIIQKALEKDPQQRYADGLLMAEDIQALLKELG